MLALRLLLLGELGGRVGATGLEGAGASISEQAGGCRFGRNFLLCVF
jgi:hypothetical protein